MRPNIKVDPEIVDDLKAFWVYLRQSMTLPQPKFTELQLLIIKEYQDKWVTSPLVPTDQMSPWATTPLIHKLFDRFIQIYTITPTNNQLDLQDVEYFIETFKLRNLLDDTDLTEDDIDILVVKCGHLKQLIIKRDSHD